MGLFDALFQRGIAGLDLSTPEGQLLHRYMKSPGSSDWPPPKVETWDGGPEILAQGPETKARLAVMASKILAGDQQGFRAGLPLKSLVGRLLRSKLPLTEEDLVSLLEDLGSQGSWEWQLPAGLVVSAIERHVAAHGLGPQLTFALRSAKVSHEGRIPSAAYRRLRRLTSSGQVSVADDIWGRRVRASLKGLSTESRAAWGELLDHAAAVTGKSRPSAKWQKQASSLVAAVGGEVVRETVSEWILDLVPSPVEHDQAALDDNNTELLRGVLWAAAPVADPRLAARLGRLVEVSFQKVRFWGPRSTRLGNGGAIALGLVPGNDGIAELTRLEAKVRYDSARRVIASTLERAADAAGLSRADLEELAVPDYGFDAAGQRSLAVGAGFAEVGIKGNGVELRWRVGDKLTKTPPKALRESVPERVKEVRELAKQIGATLAGQAARIERHYLDDRSLPFADWRLRYLEHPLVSTLTRRLLWVRETEEGPRTFWWRDGALQDLTGEPVPDAADGRVRLWHPVDSSVEQVRHARRLLTEARITQPFKQVHREVYLLTDAERETSTYSNRFAAHVLRQHQFHALCQQRGWKYALQGEFDSHNTPYRVLPSFGLKVEFWVDPAGDEATAMAIYSYLSSDRLCFRKGRHDVQLDEVPALAFSEALRDVDLFTSVTSVGNDPNWHDGGENPQAFTPYWNTFAFGDLNATATTRREVLGDLLPLLKIADRCEIDERWFRVRGHYRDYRIHLGSGHIMMEPNNQYLCIVPDRSSSRKTSKLYLPFEGDSVLSVILSKAFLLADDRAIKDSTILSQIQG